MGLFGLIRACWATYDWRGTSGEYYDDMATWLRSRTLLREPIVLYQFPPDKDYKFTGFRFNLTMSEFVYRGQLVAKFLPFEIINRDNLRILWEGAKAVEAENRKIHNV